MKVQETKNGGDPTHVVEAHGKKMEVERNLYKANPCL